MDSASEQLYARIGQRLVDVLGEPYARGFIRVELADDVGSVGLFVDRGDGSYHYRSDDEGALIELFAALRTAMVAAGLGAWSQATFALQADGTFHITFGHADISDLGQSARRRDAWVREVLGERAVIHWASD